MKHKTPQAVQSCHKTIVWLIPQLDKFPRSRRFTLGEKIEQRMLEVLSLLIEASFTGRGRRRILDKINTELTVVRHLWRVADTSHLPNM